MTLLPVDTTRVRFFSADLYYSLRINVDADYI